jgi:hypothetical protein
VNTPFADPLVVLVRDVYDNPVPGATVSFTTPATGASATLSGLPAKTDAAGTASIGATANGYAGMYGVNAAVGGAGSVNFALNNLYAVVPLFSTTKANNSGSTVPIQIQLADAEGVLGGSPAPVLTAVDVVDASGSVVGPPQSPSNSQPGNQFKGDSKSRTYQFNLQTTGYAPGTYTLRFRIGSDPTLYTISFTVR